ncbi:sigma-70 family RNA polymerase sigma factor [Terrabacter sp. Soil811]|uniref:sigma-70 family RNA polymerase sigma factor n=1 Tax=Terrabacter sp. Soil811 TaxID=1736419 RepID=UPI000ACD0DAF|nr:sigma-70 family RNA polymerase sigma factor [Terrabacter sp. Soil811]
MDSTDELDPSGAELDTLHRQSLFIPEDEATPEVYPRLTNLSAGFLFDVVVRPVEVEPVEYVCIGVDDSLETAGVVARWNMLWEAGQFRRRFFDRDELPPALARLADLGDVNIAVVPKTSSRYFEHSPLLHMLPRGALERHGLPLMRCGFWPYSTHHAPVDRYLPADFEQRLARAWAAQVWPHLLAGSRMSAFSKDDPIKLLAHNLGFWVPAATSAIQDVLGSFPLIGDPVEQRPLRLVDGSELPGAHLGRVRAGGDVWAGEEEAQQMLTATVRRADSTGNLRAVLDAVKSNRVHDDFSDRWSPAREDFERKLNHTRAKVKVSFVELPDDTPVQGPESEVVGNLVTNDFLALLDERQRRIVVLLSTGVTRQQEIAELLGYANHSPVSKRLAEIRSLAATYFGLS